MMKTPVSERTLSGLGFYVKFSSISSMLVGMATSALVNGGMAILSKQIDQFVSGLSQPPRADRREDLP